MPRKKDKITKDGSITFRLPLAIAQKFKSTCARLNLSMTDTLINLITTWLIGRKIENGNGMKSNPNPDDDVQDSESVEPETKERQKPPPPMVVK